MRLALLLAFGCVACLACEPASTSHHDLESELPESRLFGLNFGPYVIGAQGAGGDVAPQDLSRLLARVAPHTRWIRTFGLAEGNDAAPALARKLGLKTAVTAWIGRDRAQNEREIARLIELARGGFVDLAVVGSEVLLRRDVAPAELLTHLVRVKRAVPGVPVTTAAVYGELLAHPEVVRLSDVVFYNAYPFWEGVPAERAPGHLHEIHRRMRAAAQGKPVWLSETGWPSDGEAFGQAVPSLPNALRYFEEVQRWARANGVPTFYFAAYDEPWKGAAEGERGAFWGLWDRDEKLKAPFFDSLTDPGDPAHWRGETLVAGPGAPALVDLSFPAYGDEQGVVSGRVVHVRPAEYRLAVYIYVDGWWTKPGYSVPVTAMGLDGTWLCNVRTGGRDAEATSIAVFLVPVSYEPPILRKQRELPAGLRAAAAASVIVQPDGVPPDAAPQRRAGP